MKQGFSSGSFIVGVMLGAVLAGAWFSGGASWLEASSLSFPAATSTPAAAESGAIAVSNQPAGDTVTIDSVTVPPPGVWVAVREVDGGDLGNVLGAARAGGPRSSLSISLLRSTIAGRSYAVELYRDDNDGPFDLASDSVYVDFTTGAPVVAYFTTTE